MIINIVLNSHELEKEMKKMIENKTYTTIENFVQDFWDVYHPNDFIKNNNEEKSKHENN